MVGVNRYGNEYLKLFKPVVQKVLIDIVWKQFLLKKKKKLKSIMEACQREFYLRWLFKTYCSTSTSPIVEVFPPHGTCFIDVATNS